MRRLNDERGGVAVIVAIMLVVVFGMSALTIDAGSLYWERRQLQNGADAGALAIAENCARGTISCVLSVVDPMADQYADDNANDAASDGAVDPADFDPNGRVTVVTSTRNADTGSDVVDFFFARILGFTDLTVAARATAVWNVTPDTLTIFPLAFCLDQFNGKTSGGTVFGPPADSLGYHVFYKTPPVDPECPLTGDNNPTYPGGFGWLDLTSSFFTVQPGCRVSVTAEQWYPGRSGEFVGNNGTYTPCFDALTAKIDEMNADPDADPLLIPIFDDHRGSGAGGELHVIGFGAFRPTGYRFAGAASHPGGADKPCVNNENRCIRGWFTDFVTVDALVSSGGFSGGVTSFGLSN